LTIEASDAASAPSDADIAAVADAASNELAGARKYAETWQKALAGLVALTGTFLFLEGTQAPSKLEHPAVIAFLGVMGLAFAVYAALEAANGAHSRPVAVDVLGPDAAARIAEARSTQASESIDAVGRATFATILAVTLLTAAIIGTWITAKSGLSSISATVDGRETALCGELANSDAAGMTIKDGNGVSTTVAWDQVGGFSLTAEC
jgi:hypothetical protein